MTKIVFLLLTVVQVLPFSVASAAPQCASLFETKSHFNSWSIDNPKDLRSVNASDFFPESYMSELKKHDREIKLEITKNKEILRFIFETNKFEFIGKFDLWNGSKPGYVVVEHLRMQNPISSNNDNTRQSQVRKGLPKEVFYHMRNQLFDLLKKGGYSKIEIPASQDLLTYFLYKKIVGGVPATELGQKMAEYLDEVTYLAMRGDILEKRATSIDEVADYFGNYFSSPISEQINQLWSAHKSNLPLLEKNGAHFIKNSRNEIIGIKYEGSTYFVVPFLPGTPLMTWSSIHRICPECMLLLKDLN